MTQMPPMTKAQLLEQIADLPDNAPVYVATGRRDWPDRNQFQPIYSVADDTQRVVLEQ